MGFNLGFKGLISKTAFVWNISSVIA